MGIFDDIKNMESLPEHKWTLEELLEIEKKLLKPSEKSILKLLMKKDKIKFINKNKNNVIYQREKVEQDGDDERRNVVK